MNELHDLNTEVLRAEFAYRQERINLDRRVPANGGGRWLRRRNRPAPVQSV